MIGSLEVEPVVEPPAGEDHHMRAVENDHSKCATDRLPGDPSPPEARVPERLNEGDYVIGLCLESMLGFREADAVAELERLSKLKADLYEALDFVRHRAMCEGLNDSETVSFVNYVVMKLYHPGDTGPGSAAHYEQVLREAGVPVDRIWSTVSDGPPEAPPIRGGG